MTIGVILNRVFRINNNPLFEYIHQNKDKLRNATSLFHRKYSKKMAQT